MSKATKPKSNAMRALTIHQPFVAWIMCGEKRVENRTWGTDFRGRFAVHAGANRSRMKPNNCNPEHYAFSAMVGTVELTHCVEKHRLRKFIAEHPEYEWVRTHKHAFGPYLWILENPKPFKKPIPCVGKLKLWHWTPPKAI